MPFNQEKDKKAVSSLREFVKLGHKLLQYSEKPSHDSKLQGKRGIAWYLFDQAEDFTAKESFLLILRGQTLLKTEVLLLIVVL